jgi:MFS family permease
MSGFARAGHLPTLAAALLYFDVSFMTWVLLGPLAPFLRDDLGLTATEQGLLTAIPLLGGSLFRPVLGLLADRIGGRRTGLLGLVLTLVPLFIGWRAGGMSTRDPSRIVAFDGVIDRNVWPHPLVATGVCVYLRSRRSTPRARTRPVAPVHRTNSRRAFP